MVENTFERTKSRRLSVRFPGLDKSNTTMSAMLSAFGANEELSAEEKRERLRPRKSIVFDPIPEPEPEPEYEEEPAVLPTSTSGVSLDTEGEASKEGEFNDRRAVFTKGPQFDDDKVKQVLEVAALLGQGSKFIASAVRQSKPMRKLNNQQVMEDKAAEAELLAQEKRLQAEMDAYNMAVNPGGFHPKLNTRLAPATKKLLQKMEGLPPPRQRTEADLDFIERIIAVVQCKFILRFDANTRRQLANVVHYRHCSARETVVSQFSPGESFYIILNGSLDVKAAIGSGDKKSLGMCVNQLGKGDTFGEIALLSHKPHTASVVTRDMPADLLCIYKNDFVRILKTQYGASKEDTIDCLRSIPALKHADTTALNQMAGMLTPWVSYNKEVLQVDMEDKLYFVRKGEALLVESGTTRQVGHISMGDWFGEGALWHELRRGYLLVTVGDLHYYTLSKADAMNNIDPKLREKLQRDATTQVMWRDAARRAQKVSVKALRERRPSLDNFITGATGVHRNSATGDYELEEEPPPPDLKNNKSGPGGLGKGRRSSMIMAYTSRDVPEPSAEPQPRERRQTRKTHFGPM